MTFIVRQISKTSDGREIIRAASHDGDAIVIGRDSTNAIHLADLAVDMQHVRLVRLPSGKIRAEAIGSLGFDLDGRSVMVGEINPASGAEIRLGSHRLTISRDEAACVVSVSRIAAVSDSAGERDEASLFTLKGKLPGRRISAWAFLAAVLAMFLIWPIWTYSKSYGVKERPAGFQADAMWTSGPLSQAHHSLEKNCQACHVNKFEAVRDSSCQTCHKADAHDHAPIARLIRAREAPGMGGSIKSWFKTKFGVPEGGCVDCHTEHEGAGRMAPTAQAFCADCHGSLKSRLADTKLPNAADFGTSHPQFMPAVTINPGGLVRQTQRVTLTGQTHEDNGLKFPHDIHLSKNNGIARMTQTLAGDQGWGSSLECKDCHVRTPDGTRFQPITMEKNCAMCHDLAFDKIGGTLRTLRHGDPAQVVADLRAFYRSTGPSQPISLGGMARRRPGDYARLETTQDYVIGARAWSGGAEEAIRGVFSKGGACYDCHVVTGNYNIAKVFEPSRYMTHGWFDHDAHKTEKCETCHKAGTSKSATDLLLPDLNSCRTCHVGEGGASLASVKQPVKSGCAMCHDYHFGPEAPWKPGDERGRTQGRVVPNRISQR
jgi:hypothetical protein